MSSLGASQAAAGASSADPIRVMVVDDALVIRGMLSRMLEEAGDISVVASAGDGERALAQLKRNPVEVVVLDIEMPNMDGIEALPKIVSEHPNTQVVMASTLTKRNAEISLKAMELGAADYVTKPGSTGELRSADESRKSVRSARPRAVVPAAWRRSQRRSAPIRPDRPPPCRCRQRVARSSCVL